VLEGLATHEHLQPMTLLILLHPWSCQGARSSHRLIPPYLLILSSGAFLPPVAFDCLALPPACCVPDQGHCDVEEAEAELCCGHNVAVPKLCENSVSVGALPQRRDPPGAVRRGCTSWLCWTSRCALGL
jgi:hypothetical protein